MLSGRAAKQTLMALGAVVCVALIVRNWVGPHQVPTSTVCGTAPPLRGAVDPLVILVLLVASAIAGWALGGWRKASAPDDPDDPDNVAATRSSTLLLVQVGLCIFLLAMTAGLAYEAWSLKPGGCLWPLTYYVRWITYTDSWIALPVAVMFCFLMGRWLWYPRSGG